MLKPIQYSHILELGWYLHLDLHGKQAWFYEMSVDGMRTETGCLDCGPFSQTDLFLGPIEMPS